MRTIGKYKITYEVISYWVFISIEANGVFLHKGFGNVFLNSPAQRHYNQAEKWIKKQIAQLDKNITNYLE